MSDFSYRIHPAIGIARVGNSKEFYLGPETAAGDVFQSGEKENHPVPTAGLPLTWDAVNGTTGDAVKSSDLRDSDGNFKRQAARFKIYQFPVVKGNEAYPFNSSPGVEADFVPNEVTIGATDVETGLTVTNIHWTVHVANKKANTFVLIEDPKETQGLGGYRGGNMPPIRNWNIDQPPNSIKLPDNKRAILNDPARVKALTIDPGPRVINGKKTPAVSFDAATAAQVFDYTSASEAAVKPLPDYPKSFPSDSFKHAKPGEFGPGPEFECPMPQPGFSSKDCIGTLGELQTDNEGRLIFSGGYGSACGWNRQTELPSPNLPNIPPIPFQSDVNNDQWFDDASDGPVTAVIEFEDASGEKSYRTVAGAWVTTTDPSYAPQTRNVVSLYDDIYDMWVRILELCPKLYAEGKYLSSYTPAFYDDLSSIFQATALQQWNINLNSPGIDAHNLIGEFSLTTDPTTVKHPLQNYIRDPNTPPPLSEQTWDPSLPKMPAALGSSNTSFLVLTKTQYQFVKQWWSTTGIGTAKPYAPAQPPVALNAAEVLDKAVLVNCLGGRFSPGIDLTFIMLDLNLYAHEDWQTSGTGPFRVKAAPLDYDCITSSSTTFLTGGYIPAQTTTGLEPGDVSKFMAIPWHTDYNSCATHLPSPNAPGNTEPGKQMLFWSWPAQRPVAVFEAEAAAKGGSLSGSQMWSVRGKNTSTMSSPAEKWGRYQYGSVVDMLTNWANIGVVLHAKQIDTLSPGVTMPENFLTDNYYLEAGSLFQPTKNDNPVEPYPNFQGQMPKKS